MYVIFNVPATHVVIHAESASARSRSGRTASPPGTWRSSRGVHDADHARDRQCLHQARSSRGVHDADHVRDPQHAHQTRGHPVEEGMTQMMLETFSVLTRHAAILLETLNVPSRLHRKLDGRCRLVPHEEIGGQLHCLSKCLERISRHGSLSRTTQSCARTPRLRTQISP